MPVRDKERAAILAPYSVIQDHVLPVISQGRYRATAVVKCFRTSARAFLPWIPLLPKVFLVEMPVIRDSLVAIIHVRTFATPALVRLVPNGRL